MVVLPAVFGGVCVVVFNVETNLMQAEIRGGMCSSIAYILANTLVQIPSMLVLATCVTVPAYCRASLVDNGDCVAPLTIFDPSLALGSLSAYAGKGAYWPK